MPSRPRRRHRNRCCAPSGAGHVAPRPGAMHGQARELRQGRKAATVPTIYQCRGEPGHFILLPIYPLSATGYQVLARKWRPQTFGDVVGQDHVVRTLRNAVARGRIAHAYLLVGPRGTGKTSIARIFAKALNCTVGPNADFDPKDPAVVAIAEGSHLDVIEIDGASNNSVEQVRDLRETSRYAPAQGKYKIYIIDEVHMLSTAAFNALLKTLEEPPPHVKFVFATTEVQKVLPTILSRCQRFDLKPIPADLISERLRAIAAAEKVKVDAAALDCIARLADGGMRDAQSILDQMISFCGGEIAEADVLDVYGLVAEAKVAELAGAVAAGDHRLIVSIVDECDSAGRHNDRWMVSSARTSWSEAYFPIRAASKPQVFPKDAIAVEHARAVVGGRG